MPRRYPALSDASCSRFGEYPRPIRAPHLAQRVLPESRDDHRIPVDKLDRPFERKPQLGQGYVSRTSSESAVRGLVAGWHMKLLTEQVWSSESDFIIQGG